MHGRSEPGSNPARDAIAERVEALFTRSDGYYRFARWARPLVPACFGLEDEAARVMREAIGAVAALTGLGTAAEDPDLGVNTMVFACEDWVDLRATPGLDQLIPDIARLTQVLAAAGANQYRIFGFEPEGAAHPGAIRLSITLIRWDEDLARLPWRVIAASQSVQSVLLWSDHAFTAESPVAEIEGTGRAVVVPFVQDLVRAAHAPGLPDAADDAAHAALLAGAMRHAALGDAGDPAGDADGDAA
ncbi:MAG: hypothetical protein AAF577_05220 [Pseudomonadota bacterium]